MKKTALITAALLMGGLFCTAQAHAHYPWINADNYTPRTGETPHITIGWGHRYPLGKFLSTGDLEEIFIIAPDHGKTPLTPLSGLEFEPENTLAAPGPYLVAGQRRDGFYTKTTQGGKRRSKKGLDNVISCSLPHMSMKAVINAGDRPGKADAVAGHPLEIVPLADPSTLRAGDYLPLRLLLHGKPYSGRIFATPMGFSTDKDVFAYTGKTDRQGLGRIRILQPGVWLIKAEHQQPYPDPKVCDVESYIATLTLEVK